MAAANVAVADKGVGVLFYDLRNDVPDPEGDPVWTADVWFISAPPGARGLEAWKGRERHVAGPFDLFKMPAHHIGSNQGVVGTPGGFVSAYTLGVEPPSTVGPTDIFFSRFPPIRDGL